MIDLAPKTIKHLFEKQVDELTKRTIAAREDFFDYQLSGAWLR